MRVTGAKSKIYYSYELTESRKELLELLANDLDQFIERMVAHFETLAGFIPALDEIFEKTTRKRK